MLKTFKTSSSASLISIDFGARSCFRNKLRIRRMTSLARWSSLRFVQRRRVSHKKHFGRLGVAEDRTERLVQFVCDRRGKFADGGNPRHVGQFLAIPLKLELHRFRSVMSTQQKTLPEAREVQHGTEQS